MRKDLQKEATNGMVVEKEDFSFFSTFKATTSNLNNKIITIFNFK